MHSVSSIFEREKPNGPIATELIQKFDYGLLYRCHKKTNKNVKDINYLIIAVF